MSNNLDRYTMPKIKAKEKSPLEALKELRFRITNFNGKFHNYNELVGTIEAALEDYEYLKLVAKPLTDEEKKSINSVARRLKALEILKQFDAFRIIQVQGQWFLIMGDVFVKAPKIPITEEQASLLTEVLTKHG